MKSVLSLFFVVFASLKLFSQNDSTYHMLQLEIEALRTQRTQDSLKVDLLTQELQQFFEKATKQSHVNVEKANVLEDSLRIQQQLTQIRNIKASSTHGAAVMVGPRYAFQNIRQFRPLQRFGTCQNCKYQNSFNFRPNILSFGLFKNCKLHQYYNDQLSAKSTNCCRRTRCSLVKQKCRDSSKGTS